MTRGQLRQEEVEGEARYSAVLREFIYHFYFCCGRWLLFISGTLIWRFLEFHIWPIKDLIIPGLIFSPGIPLIPGIANPFSKSLESAMCEGFHLDVLFTPGRWGGQIRYF